MTPCHALIALSLASVLVLTTPCAASGDRPSPGGAAATGNVTYVPTYGVRVYEVFVRGPKLDLEERTARAFAPHHVRNIAVGEVFPPADQPAMLVFRSRDSLGFFGSYWREDSTNDYGDYTVEVMEEEGATEPGTTLVRVKIVPRADVRPERAPRRNLHPERPVMKLDAGQAAPAPAAP